MSLSQDLIAKFVKVTNDSTKPQTETTLYGTIVEYAGEKYVKIDGSDHLTPLASMESTTDIVGIKPADRVTVMIKNHTATITGNLTAPSVNSNTLNDATGGAADKIAQFEILLADKVSTGAFTAATGRISTLETNNLEVNNELIAQKATINDLKSFNVTVSNTFTAHKAFIDDLDAKKIDADVVKANYASIEKLESIEGDFHKLESTYATFSQTTTDKLTSIDGTIKNLDSTYANIDFANIGEAAIKKFYSTSGIIKNLTVANGTCTGELAGVTITGDLIKANTVLADRLVIKGTNGLYYKLNTDGMKTEAEQTNQNSLDGSVILAKSITATKINVSDLVAFDATIGGFHITDSSLYSGVKSTVDNTTRGIYLDNDGQTAFGDANRFVKYYKDGSAYKLALSADDITLSGNNLSATLSDLTVQINDVEVGGRNIILNSSFEGVSNTDGMEFDSSARSITYKSTALGSTKSLSRSVSEYGKTRIRGRKVTISGEYKVNESITYGTTNPWIGMELSVRRDDSTGGSTQWLSWLGSKTVSNDNIGKWVKVSKTVSVTDYDHASVSLAIILRDFTGSISLRNLKVEFGNRATDWTPAPEDVDSNISDAAKTATNYLSFDGSGLVVGDMTKSSLGKNVIIDSDSVDIRSGSTVLASFGASVITLGQNSANSVINLCDGAGTIRALTSGASTSYPAYDSIEIASQEINTSSQRFVTDVTNSYGVTTTPAIQNDAQIYMLSNKNDAGSFARMEAMCTTTSSGAEMSAGASAIVYDTYSTTRMLIYAHDSTDTLNRSNQVNVYPHKTTFSQPLYRYITGHEYAIFDESMDGGWVTVTSFGSGFALYDTNATSKVQYRKRGKIVEIRGVVKPTSAITGGTTNHTIFTLPSGYRPSGLVHYVCQGSGVCTWLLSVTNAGLVRFARYSNGTAYAEATAGTWLPFAATFLID